MQGRKSNRSRKSTFFIDSGERSIHPSRKLVDHFELDALQNKLLENDTSSVLDFSFSNLGDEGVIILAKSMRHNSSVISLNLADTQMTDKGLAALLVMLKTNKTLIEVDVSRNFFSIPGLLDSLKLSLNLNHQIQVEVQKRKQLK